MLHYIMHVFVRHERMESRLADQQVDRTLIFQNPPVKDVSWQSGSCLIDFDTVLFLFYFGASSKIMSCPFCLTSKSHQHIAFGLCREATEPKFQVLGVSKDVAGMSWILSTSKKTEVDVDGCVPFLAKIMEDRFAMV